VREFEHEEHEQAEENWFNHDDDDDNDDDRATHATPVHGTTSDVSLSVLHAMPTQGRLVESSMFGVGN
jgi:hypothetical protein